MKKILVLILIIMVTVCFAPGCGQEPVQDPAPSDDSQEQSQDQSTEDDTMTEEQKNMVKVTYVLHMKIGDTPVSVDWEDNAAVDALAELASRGWYDIQLSMYGGFEQVGAIGEALPAEDEQTTTDPGDIVLYSGDQIVVFYGNNSWAYTRLGHITDKTEDEMAELLGNGDVKISLMTEYSE